MTGLKKNGFQIDHEPLNISAYQQHRFSKTKDAGDGNTQKGNMISYSSVDFQGVITVDRPEPFYNILFSGLGRAKGFGCGMFMVRRI